MGRRTRVKGPTPPPFQIWIPRSVLWPARWHRDVCIDGGSSPAYTKPQTARRRTSQTVTAMSTTDMSQPLEGITRPRPAALAKASLSGAVLLVDRKGWRSGEDGPPALEEKASDRNNDRRAP